MKPPIGEMQHSSPVNMHHKGTPPAPPQQDVPHKRANAVMRLDTSHVRIGDQLAQAIITRRQNFTALEKYMADADNEDLRTCEAAMGVLLGFSRTAAAVFDAARLAGVPVNGESASAADVEYAFSLNRQRAVDHFKAALKNLVRLMEAVPDLDVSFGEASRADAQESKPAEPLEMRIVGMPDRQTTSTVERDHAGNIIKTSQTEVDA